MLCVRKRKGAKREEFVINQVVNHEFQDMCA